jgi:O-antigen/teichoic acid export membrane protein
MTWSRSDHLSPRIQFAQGFRQGFSTSFLGNASWSFLGNVTYAAAQWLILAVLARNLGTVAVGKFAFALAVVAPIFMFLSFQLRVILVTGKSSSFAFADLLTFRMISSLGALLIAAACGIAFGARGETLIVLVAVATAKFADSVADILSGPFQSVERLGVPALIYAVNGVASLLFVVLATAVSGSIVVVTLAWAIASFVALTLAVVMTRIAIRQRTLGDLTGVAFAWDPAAVKEILRTAFPLGLVLLLISLNSAVPRLLLEREEGLSELGVFAAISTVLVVGDFLMRSIWQTALPRLSRVYRASEAGAFRRLMAKLLAFSAACAAAGLLLAWFLGDWFMELAFGKEFVGYHDSLMLLAAATGVYFLCTFLGAALNAAEKYQIQAKLLAAVLAVSSATAFVLIPDYGLVGASLAILVGALMQLCLSGIAVVPIVRKTT